MHETPVNKGEKRYSELLTTPHNVCGIHLKTVDNLKLYQLGLRKGRSPLPMRGIGAQFGEARSAMRVLYWVGAARRGLRT